jgi:hypothetical protein
MMMSETLARESALDTPLAPAAPADDDVPPGPVVPAGSTLAAPKPPQPGELKYRLTLFLFPSILLVFVALYVTSLASGVPPEMGLLRAGGASVVLAILARVAISILGDDSRMVLSESQIRAIAQSDTLREKLLAGINERETDAAGTNDDPLAPRPAATADAPLTAPLAPPAGGTLTDTAVFGGKE